MTTKPITFTGANQAPPGFHFAPDPINGGLRLIASYKDAGGNTMEYTSNDLVFDLLAIARNEGVEMADRLKAFEIIGAWMAACLGFMD